MKFSVIIPLYNKAPYVRKALETVCAQTYRDYEIIIINDGSTDNSFIIAEEYLKGIGGVNYKIINQPNAGVAAARNNGVAQANGNYLAFLDADDWWEPTYLERMVKLIGDYPDAGLYACNYYYHKDGNNIVKVQNIKTGYINYPKTYYETFAMPVWTGATIIPQKVFKDVGGFPLGIKLGEDFLLWAKIAMQYPIVYLNELLAYYNNTIPTSYRVTRQLHDPKYHMLFNLNVVFPNDINDTKYATSNDWIQLIDMLRLFGLHDYWLSDEFHDIAQREINKVNLSSQKDFLIQLYKTPRWIQKIISSIEKIGSAVKQWIIRLKAKGNE